MASAEKKKGPWRQDSLEPRIVLDGSGEFFAIGASVSDASQIVAALNAAEEKDVLEWNRIGASRRVIPLRERQT